MDETLHTQAENELRRKLIINFVKDNRGRFKEIEEAFNAGDLKTAHRLAHTLKGNAAQLGKTLLRQAAADVEYGLKDGNNFVTSRQMSMLEMELNAVLAELEPLYEEYTQSAAAVQTEPLDAQSARELIENLEPLLEMGNPECRELIDNLRRIPGSETLTQQIEDLDFEPAIDTLAELKKKLEVR